MTALSVALAVLALFPLSAAVYLAALAACSWRGAPTPAGPARLRFDVVVPAHDEAAQIARTVSGLCALDYPRELFRVWVVADNCADETAAEARAAGASVLVRHDDGRRGKGYALAHAFAHLCADDFADAMVVVDADTDVDRDLLSAFAARLERGEGAIQSEYQVRDAVRSWRTRLLALALAMFHTTRSLARENLGLSCGLRGNGMCFSREALLAVPYRAYSLVEDVEYGVRLAEAGLRVTYVPEVAVRGDMPADGAAARSQRARWEAGRGSLRRVLLAPLLLRVLRERRAMLLDLALDLATPPLSRVVAATALLGLAALFLRGPLAWLPQLELGISALSLFVYVARGWWISGTGWRGLADLCAAPLYLVWKWTLAFRRDPARRGEWVRTARTPEALR